MNFKDRPDFAEQVADLNRYGQAINQCETVDEVVSMTLEAVSLLLELSDLTVYEVRDGELRVRGSTNPEGSEGDAPTDIASKALSSGEIVSQSASDGPAVLAVPEGIVDDIVTVIEVRSTTRTEFGDEFVRPLEILASHAATAMSNIRSRRRLERAREDLETRKEMVEMYDRLLRHDLGNDLQVIAGFADVLATRVDDEESVRYVEKIQRAANNSVELIDSVGTLVSTLEAQQEPEPQDLRPVLADTVRDVRNGYEPLSIDFQPADFEYRVYAGDLLDSVFGNILSNAAVHNDGPVRVRVYAEEPGPEAVVVGMADDGGGIPEEVRDGLFEMGVKGPESDGSGFGLGFVRALTESYGGAVAVGESQEGGADFRVRLDRA
jgi:signal transduction histidine kinase